MLQKLMIGFMAVTIVAAFGGGMIDALSRGQVEEVPSIIDAAAVGQDTAPVSASRGNSQAGAVAGIPNVAEPQLIQQSLESVGEVWAASAEIVELDATGMFVKLEDSSEVFVELGPDTYWLALGVPLAVGETVAIDGFFNGENYHAQLVTRADGQQLVLRTPQGQPLWSGGVNGGQGGQGTGSGQEAIAPDAWITFTGEIIQNANSEFVMQLDSGEVMAFQLGQPSFWQNQGVTLASGDAISLLGFYQGEQFTVAEVTNTVTGERIMLRDPNGRPLWAGPGRNGAGAGQHTTVSQ